MFLKTVEHNCLDLSDLFKPGRTRFEEEEVKLSLPPPGMRQRPLRLSALLCRRTFERENILLIVIPIRHKNKS